MRMLAYLYTCRYAGLHRCMCMAGRMSAPMPTCVRVRARVCICPCTRLYHTRTHADIYVHAHPETHVYFFYYFLSCYFNGYPHVYVHPVLSTTFGFRYVVMAHIVMAAHPVLSTTFGFRQVVMAYVVMAYIVMCMHTRFCRRLLVFVM